MEKVAYQKLLTKAHIGLGAVLTIVFYVVMTFLLVPFTFSPDPTVALMQAAFTAVPIATTFWFAYHMFMLVLVDQRKRKREAN